jgi:hypothetical protein
MPAEAGIQNYLKTLDSRYRIKSGTGPAGKTSKDDLSLFAKPTLFDILFFRVYSSIKLAAFQAGGWAEP